LTCLCAIGRIGQCKEANQQVKPFIQRAKAVIRSKNVQTGLIIGCAIYV
jgi:hypothetical protein